MAMPWDTMVGVARRSWAGNENAVATAAEYNEMRQGSDLITLPNEADADIVNAAVDKVFGKN